MIETLLPIISAFTLTLLAHVLAKIIGTRFKVIPTIVTALVLVLVFLAICQWDYQNYYQAAKPLFDHLLGYVVVLLAVPLASMNFTGLPLKRLLIVILIGTLVGALVPMSLAYLFSLSHDTILSFATRSVTTPVGLSIAKIINSSLVMVNLIIIVSGIIGAGFAKLILRNVKDDRAKGLAMGMMAHAFGTIEAWQISQTAGRYSAFGLSVNGLITAIWLPIFLNVFI